MGQFKIKPARIYRTPDGGWMIEWQGEKWVTELEIDGDDISMDTRIVGEPLEILIDKTIPVCNESQG